MNCTMGDLEVITTADRRDLDEQARDALRTVWPEFIFPDPVSAEHIGRVETYFPQYDVLLLHDGQVVAGGWGVPIGWDGTVSALPDGYVVPDALDLVAIDREQDRGTYAETNLWMRHA